SASRAQTSPTTPFNGSSGTGWGTLANRPTTCTPGVAYFATDQGSWNTSTSNPYGVQQNGADGVLYKCTALNTWTLYYTPYVYPHPLQSGATPTPTPTPTPTATATPTPRPTVTTNPATNVASFSATLNGSVNPRGSTTTVDFRWGTTTSYGHTTPMQTKTGNTSLPITANISGLNASHLYHFRIVATNGGGTSFCPDRTFTTLPATGPPVVTTNPATNVTASSARLNGSLDPHGLTTTVYFQYGTTTSYGHATAMVTQTGDTYRNIAANISGLAMHT